MNPRVWGPSVWAALHLIALGYPEHPTAEQRDLYRRFFVAVGPVLPCAACAAHFEGHLRALPIDPALEAGGRALFVWTVALHNLVNAQMGKPELQADQVAARLLVQGGGRSGGLLSPGGAHALGLGVLVGAAAGAVAMWAYIRARRTRA